MKKLIKDYGKMVSVIILTFILTFHFLQQKEGVKGEIVSLSPSVDYWEMFAGISMEQKFVEEAEAYYPIPVFTPVLLDLKEKEIMLSGYYLPYSQVDSVIIISRYPYANCFFCGGAGVESVAMVELKKASSKSYRTDQILMVKGTLELNNTDFKKLVFVIKNATVEEL